MTADAPVTVLVHSPLTGPAAWGGLPEVLRHRGREVAVVEVTDDARAPYAARFVAQAALQLRAELGDRPTVLVGHSGAGYLLPLIGAARRALRSPVAAYVFCDAGLPAARPSARLDLMRAEMEADEPDDVRAFKDHIRSGGRFPEWTEDDLRDLVPDDTSRAALVASLRPRGGEFWTEPLPVAEDWPDAPCGYVRLSSSYDSAASSARSRGWPVVTADPSGGHFAMISEPELVADLLTAVLDQLR